MAIQLGILAARAALAARKANKAKQTYTKTRKLRKEDKKAEKEGAKIIFKDRYGSKKNYIKGTTKAFFTPVKGSKISAGEALAGSVAAQAGAGTAVNKYKKKKGKK
jgi:hypothetical protein